jgi:predicted AAA+ superfamily ATPase
METMGFQFSSNLGKYLENIVYLQLRRLNHYEIYYYKTKNDLEVDFCLRKDRKITTLIQVTQHLNAPETRDREIRALATAMDELKMQEAIIITLDESEIITLEDKTIKVVSIVNWLVT